MLNATCSKFSMNLLHLYKGCTLIIQNILVLSLSFRIKLRDYACFFVSQFFFSLSKLDFKVGG